MKVIVRATILFLLTLTVSLSVRANAVRIGITVNNPSNLHVVWQVSGPEAADLIEGDWETFVMLTNNVLTVGGRHVTNPHPELGEVFADPILVKFDFEGSFPITFSTTFLHGQRHFDVWRIVISRANTPETVIVDVTASHVPEPATLILLGTGLAGVAITRYRRYRVRA